MRIRRAAVDAIVEHARRDHPRECCGLLIGFNDRVLESRAARNLKESEVAYQVDPADHFEAIRHARSIGLAVIGAYHSHPRTAAVPSPTDVREANDPEFVHLIISLAATEPDIAAFRIGDGRATPVRLIVEA